MWFLNYCSNVFNDMRVKIVMNKKGLVGIIILVGIVLFVGFFWFVSQTDEVEKIGCVPASCCHAIECVLESEAPNCSGSVCTMDCRPETMDCGQGYCKFVDGECEVAWDE